MEKKPRRGYLVFGLGKEIKKQTGASYGSRFERIQELISAEPATSDPDNSDEAGAEERKRSWLRN